jgi:WD40 repeat protein
MGQTVQVETNGVVNSITFNPDGSATIVSPGGRSVPATWTASGNQLCLAAGGPAECFPYAQAFQAGQPVTLTSSCNATSRWLASSVNQPVQQQRAGERG